jgi:hypothetical protein
MKFRTQFDERPRYHSNVGSRIKKLYAPRFDDAGQMELVEKGEENLYDYIQSHADSVNINTLLRRFQGGETDVLSRVQGAYGDFTGLPTSYADLLNAVNDGHQYFDSLPVEVRARFHHNFAEFMAAMDSPDFFKMLGIHEEKPVKAEKVEKVEEVVE